MKEIDEKVLQDIFNAVVKHFELWDDEWLSDISFTCLSRYFVGVRHALCIACDLDCDSCFSIANFFDKKTHEYFGGKESE